MAPEGEKPPVTGGAHRLPFGQLSPLKFEELCLWLVRREGCERAGRGRAVGRRAEAKVAAERQERRRIGAVNVRVLS